MGQTSADPRSVGGIPGHEPAAGTLTNLACDTLSQSKPCGPGIDFSRPSASDHPSRRPNTGDRTEALRRWNGLSVAEKLEIRAESGAIEGASFPQEHSGSRRIPSLTDPTLVAASHIAKWNGTSWMPLGHGTSDRVQALTTFDDGQGRALYAGGSFASAFDSHDSNLAKWGSCSAGTPYCFGDAGCPCANDGPVGAGCLGSNGTGGHLISVGRASLSSDTVRLEASGTENGPAVYVQGTARMRAPFGDGLRCAGGALIRLGTVTNVSGASQYPGPGDASVSVKGSISSAGSRAYQVIYRDVFGFCAPGNFNTTNGLGLTWTP